MLLHTEGPPGFKGKNLPWGSCSSGPLPSMPLRPEIQSVHALRLTGIVSKVLELRLWKPKAEMPPNFSVLIKWQTPIPPGTSNYNLTAL